MIDIKNPADCCGCTACASICMHQAITMKPDALGFLYPEVDKDKCTDCGLCERVCAFHDNYDKSLNLPQPDAYAARHKDVHEVETSRSGAAFIAISDYIIEQGGVIYGAGYTDHFRVVHKRAITKEERNEFKGSKYVQSDLSGIFRQVKEDLKNGKIVLFSGTPCQTAGLHSYVGKKLRGNLFLVDIVCHGVPAPYIWKDYLTYNEKKYNKIITSVDFRDKSQIGWSKHVESLTFNQEKIYSNSYTYIFYKHIMFRHSCGACKYTNLQRPSDITIADFWGWEKTDTTINVDNKGVSLIFSNTEKGQKILDSVKDRMTIIPVELENCMQPNLINPSEIHPKRMAFEKDYMEKGFVYVMKKYGDIGWQYKIKRFLGRCKRLIKRLIDR